MTAPVPLSKALNAQIYGGKAAQLGAAIKSGLRVPDGYALDPGFVDDIVSDDSAAYAMLVEICAQISGPMAVRSSAIGEDGTVASFAGQHATLLNVRGAESAITAIKEVWQSGRSDAALAYRKRAGVELDVHVGVVVQKLVVADVAGVLFSCNPVTGADELVIEASWGLGEAVVQGLIIPDRYRVAHTGEILEQVAGVKDIAVRLAANGATLEEAVSSDLVQRLCLDQAMLLNLRELVRRCDDVFGPGPHDIEWAIEGQTIYLLQRRPVTSAKVM